MDSDRQEVPYDVFGRERHAEYKEDMGGVGSFLRDNKTLYVGRLTIYKNPSTEEVIRNHFSEWGPIEQSKIYELFF